MNLDVFNSDAFSLQELTAAFNKVPHKPMRLGELGLFQEEGIMTTAVQVESQDGQLSLIQSSARGTAAKDPHVDNRRKMRTFNAFHFERDSKVYADEVQGVRAFGSSTELQTVQQLVTSRLATLVSAHEVTLEYHRVNAVRGILLDADGTTLYNLFTEFGVEQQTQNFAFTTATTDVLGAIVAAKRLSEAELGGLFINGWRIFASSGWFDSLVAHANVKDAYKYQQSQALRSDLRSGFVFGDVTIEEYRGSVAKPNSVGGGTATFIDTDCAYLVPQVDPSNPMFITRFAPADYEETVNTMGLPRYAKSVPDPSGLNKYRLLNTQSNPICLNLRPRAVIKLTKS